MVKLNVDMVRRAQIGAGRRSRTRIRLLAAARRLFGHAGGRSTRVEDICAVAKIARGTFYNYFPSLDALQSALFEDLSVQFDQAVHVEFEKLDGPAARTSAAVRYYLGHMLEDQEWGWGMVNTGMGIGQFHDIVTGRVAETIQEGMDAGDFSIGSAVAGRDILLGSGLAAAQTLLSGQAAEDHIANVARGVLRSFGLSETRANELVLMELPTLSLIAPPNMDSSSAQNRYAKP